ncbi:uncharacterized protein LOC125647370 [Ostrea edulis]|uniref:uncharacterized protein LOC125647370 n=1 Tax=Ostrea edulis TaxID=37623 RepID=UPI0024AEB5A3|nr:uncharacterized protein LOC125647370 [Ostrea edulis]
MMFTTKVQAAATVDESAETIADEPVNATFHLSLSGLSTNQDDRQGEDSFLADNSHVVPDAIQENSIRDKTIDDITHADDVEPEYEVVESGTKRGKRKLVDKRGFEYTIKKQKGEDCIYWRCSKRGKDQPCPATVIQRGNNFQEGLRNHVHPAEPGVDLAVKLKTEVKRNATQNIFTQSAPRVVEVALSTANIKAPPASRPKPANMTRMANRVRRNLRPQDPQDLDFIFVMWGDPVNAWVKFYKKSIPPRRNSYFTCMTGV